MPNTALVFATRGIGRDAERGFKVLDLESGLDVGSTYRIIKMNPTMDDLIMVRECISIQEEYDRLTKLEKMVG
jgi:hypothetical protein